MVTPESVKSGILGGLACEHVEVVGDGQHFQALVVSGEFAGRSRVQRHLLVSRFLEGVTKAIAKVPIGGRAPNPYERLIPSIV